MTPATPMLANRMMRIIEGSSASSAVAAAAADGAAAPPATEAPAAAPEEGAAADVADPANSSTGADAATGAEPLSCSHVGVLGSAIVERETGEDEKEQTGRAAREERQSKRSEGAVHQGGVYKERFNKTSSRRQQATAGHGQRQRSEGGGAERHKGHDPYEPLRGASRASKGVIRLLRVTGGRLALLYCTSLHSNWYCDQCYGVQYCNPVFFQD